jgi:cell division septal protein FtsQ
MSEPLEQNAFESQTPPGYAPQPRPSTREERAELHRRRKHVRRRRTFRRNLRTLYVVLATVAIILSCYLVWQWMIRTMDSSR